jgi:hypothetical protein
MRTWLSCFGRLRPATFEVMQNEYRMELQMLSQFLGSELPMTVFERISPHA